MKPLLAVEGLEKRFGAVIAARGYDVALVAGETVGVIGANGAGKTTFVNVVTGWTRPDAGRVRFDGRDVTGLAPRALLRAGIARAFQAAQVFPTLTVGENLVTAAALATRRGLGLLAPVDAPAHRAAADDLLRRFGLRDVAGRLAAELPQGQRKLLDVAMACAARPRLLLLDEPTSGVSAEEKFALFDAVLAGIDAGDAETTLVFVEHDMDIVTRYARRVLAFWDGTIVKDAPPAEALADPRVRAHVLGEVDAAAGGVHAG